MGISEVIVNYFIRVGQRNEKLPRLLGYVIYAACKNCINYTLVITTELKKT
jgi:hypothetical protein